MGKKVVVQRLEEGSRTEYYFVSLVEALEFIKQSEKAKVTEEGFEVDGAYEIYMPRNYS